MWQRFFWLMAVLVWGHTAHGQTAFRQVFGDSACYDEGYSIIPYGTGYLVSTTQQCGGGWQANLLLLDANGDSVGIVNPNGYNGYIRSATDGGYLFLGGNKPGLAYDTIVIAKTTNLLDTVWTRPIHLPECNNQVYDLIEVADGYVVVGIFSETACNMGPSYQSFAVKLDLDGNVLWQKTYGDTGDDELFVVRQKSNGQLWYYGWHRNVSGEFPWLLVTDANGDSITSYTNSTLGDGFGYGFDLTADGGFITISYSDSIYARKFDSSLAMEWERGLGLQSGGIYFRAFEMRDLNYGFLACVDGPNGCNSHLYKLTTEGNVVWGKNWNGLLRTVCEPEPGQYLLTGYTNAFPVLPEALVVRFDTIFDSIPDFILEPKTETGNLTLFPNPAQGKININCTETLTEVVLLSADGRLLYTQAAHASSYAMDLPKLPQGFYLLRVQTIGGRFLFRKILVAQ